MLRPRHGKVSLEDLVVVSIRESCINGLLEGYHRERCLRERTESRDNKHQYDDNG
ncbi:MAG TPA: hypothetical protein VMV94_05940 [Phycisphaerae bacterium]|nr:hypothetical protein [Phycisphaerae bacterium]